MAEKQLLSIRDLRIDLNSKVDDSTIIDIISFDVKTNEVVAIVGESGSGKSMTALAIMGLLSKDIFNVSGCVDFNNQELLDLSNKELQQLRGKDIGMIFQEPMSSLNPSMTCGKQVFEILKKHTNLTKSELKAEVLDLFERVKLPNPPAIYKAYPHKISGGQKQRVMIAMAIACKPKLLIADEPTTALDVTVQKEILELLLNIQKENKMSILFISHDLALVSEFADRVIVMYKGNIVEQGQTEQIYFQPKHTYTQALFNSRPATENRLKRLPTVSDFINDKVNTTKVSTQERELFHNKLYEQKPLLEIIDIEKNYLSKQGIFKPQKPFKAVDGVSFNVYEGETLGLVGESGCGKSTLSNAILQLDKATSGIIKYRGRDITKLVRQELRALRKDIQIIFQDPFASLNPRMTIGKAIEEPMQVHGIGSNSKDRKEKVMSILEHVGLSATDYYKYPHEFSGGQRQRVGIARSITLEPKLIICDESVSALDISVQARVLNLLNDLKENFKFTYIFISHDLAVVKYMSDKLVVMNQGKIEEIGEADDLYTNPKKDYTKKLISAIPKGLQ